MSNALKIINGKTRFVFVMNFSCLGTCLSKLSKQINNAFINSEYDVLQKQKNKAFDKKLYILTITN